MRQRENERIVEPLNDKIKKEPISSFQITIPHKKINELILSETTKSEIKSIISKVKNYDLLYNKFGLREIDKTGGRTAINLYGPPGTGKSFVAEAIATELNRKVLKVNYAEIESKYVGETPKNIHALFKLAKEKDAVLIFDEADSILSGRISNVSQSTDHAVNLTKSVMLTELDNFSGITIFTTNFGGNYDPAFVRRIIGHIKFKLPESKDRELIIKKQIPRKLPVELSENDYIKIANNTTNFSGGDLLNVIIYASSQAVERMGENCKVSLEDFEDAIEMVREAKKNIGINMNGVY